MYAMRDDATRSAREAASTVRDLADATRDGMACAADRARAQAARISRRAAELAGDAGAAMEAWTADARAAATRSGDWITGHPLQVLAATVTLGYVLGRIVFRPRA
jgi:ElaB/YqjD/DUF883 family membrane-anchored ribosome-binding protein